MNLPLSAGSSNRSSRPCRINYRHSIRGLATTPAAFDWSASHFTSTLHQLPGLEADAAATVSTGEAIAFWILGPLALAGALGMVFARNAVH